MEHFADAGKVRAADRLRPQRSQFYVPPASAGIVDEPPPPATGIAISQSSGITGQAPYDRVRFVDLCRSTDVVVALVVLAAVFLIANADTAPRDWNDFLLLRLTFPKLVEVTVFAFVWQQVFRLFGLYDKGWMPSLREEMPRVVAACSVGAIASMGFALLSESGAFRGVVSLLAWGPMVLATLSTRYAARKLAEGGQRREPERVLVVGSGPLAYGLYRDLIEHRVAGEHEVVGFVDTNPDVRYGEISSRLLGNLDQLEQLLMHTVVDEVLVALPIKSQYAAIQRVIEECERAGVRSRYSPHLFRAKIASARIETSDRGPAIAMNVSPNGDRVFVKRAIDIFGAAVGTALSAPLWLLIALAIKVTSSGPVFFAQERYGWRKRRFRMLKFRTMVTDAEALQAQLEARNEAGGPVFKIADDPRVTAVGRFLRKTSLDELPQLWNVLRGDMSLVGPRPLPMRDVHLFSEAWLMRRFSVLPGITGLWQVSGRSDLTFDQWMQLDLEYIDRWSIALDMRILARTIPAVLRGTGAA